MSEHFAPPLRVYYSPEGAEACLDQPLNQIFAASMAIDPNKQNMRAFQPEGSETPSFAVRYVRYHDYFGPEAHLRHLEALREGDINIPDTRIEVATYDSAYMATRWVMPAVPQLLSERVIDPAYIDGLRLALGGLEHYTTWTQSNREPYIMFDIFDLAQFEYGAPEAGNKPATWLIDIEPMVCAIDRFKPPIEQLKARVDTLAHFGQRQGNT